MNKDKKLIDEAIMDLDKIQELLKENTEEILRATMRGEINHILKEDLSDEDEYEEEEVAIDTPEGEEDVDISSADNGEDVDVDIDVDDAPSENDEPEPDDTDVDIDLTAQPEVVDLTQVPDEEVISVFKKLKDSDEIEVVSNNEVNIKDPESGNEYHVVLNSESEVDNEPVYDIELDSELEDDGLDYGDENVEPEENSDLDLDLDVDVDTNEDESSEGLEYEVELDNEPTEDEDEDEEEDEENLGESVADIAEDMIRTAMGDRKMGTEKPAPNTGDIDGQKASIGSNTGDNLKGGFDDDQPYAHAEADYIMEDEDEDVIDEEEIDEELRNQEGNDRKNKYSTGRTAQPKGDAVRKQGMSEELQRLKEERKAFKQSLNKFKKVLADTVIYNNNLKNVTKLFTENSTSRKEKENIIERFDNVKSITESENLYKTISMELKAKKPIAEGITLDKPKTSSTSKLNQKTAYVDQDAQRILELMERVEGKKLI